MKNEKKKRKRRLIINRICNRQTLYHLVASREMAPEYGRVVFVLKDDIKRTKYKDLDLFKLKNM